jgi:hypothetical protein
MQEHDHIALQLELKELRQEQRNAAAAWADNGLKKLRDEAIAAAAAQAEIEHAANVLAESERKAKSDTDFLESLVGDVEWLEGLRDETWAAHWAANERHWMVGCKAPKNGTWPNKLDATENVKQWLAAGAAAKAAAAPPPDEESEALSPWLERAISRAKETKS